MRTFIARLEILTVAALVAIPFIGCSGRGGTDPSPHPGVAAVVITSNELTLPVGGRVSSPPSHAMRRELTSLV